MIDKVLKYHPGQAKTRQARALISALKKIVYIDNKEK